DSVRARLKRAAQDGADLRPRKKRRAIAIPESDDSDASADAVSDDDEYEVVRVSQHREKDGQRQYLVTWEDGSTAWKDGGDLEGCAKLVQLYERYIGKYPDKMITYAKFIHRDVPAMRLMAANHGDDCAVHAVATLFLMIGLHEEAMALEKLGRAFIASLTVKSSDRVVPSSRSRGLKFVELIRFLRDEVPKVGWRIDLDAFSKKNWYCGQKKGWEAVAALAFSEKMEEGLYLVHAYKKTKEGHCVALQYKDEEMMVQENGVSSGIGDQFWITDISFVRRVRLFPIFS
uniref:Chromo domain-containing protein n=1 Tax=Globisporangium ultimum (strain ATCC 200006 / CBS 805.95 / DAOM BR144) TaxID=431595 RepID=K3XDH0_GLOUD